MLQTPALQRCTILKKAQWVDIDAFVTIFKGRTKHTAMLVSIMVSKIFLNLCGFVLAVCIWTTVVLTNVATEIFKNHIESLNTLVIVWHMGIFVCRTEDWFIRIKKLVNVMKQLKEPLKWETHSEVWEKTKQLHLEDVTIATFIWSL